MLTLHRRTLVVLALAGLIVVHMAVDASAAPLDGVVYDALSGKPLEGVRLQLHYDVTDASEPGISVPAARLLPGEQDQVTDADGRYSFDLPGGRVYRLEPTSNADHYSFPSIELPPESGFPRFGDIAPETTPRNSGARPFYIRFDATSSNARFHNNHVALDALKDVVQLELRSDRTIAGIGDVVGFVATLKNGGARDLSGSTGPSTYLLLVAPRGVSVNLRSAAVEIRASPNSDWAQSLSGARFDGKGDRLVRFGPFDLPPGAELRLRYQATIGMDGKPGRYLSRLVAQDAGGVDLSSQASASVAVNADRDFSTSTILGRAFCDANNDGLQDSNEDGVYGARIYADTGAIAVSDPKGRFHFTRILPGSHVLKIDKGSLAGGSSLGSDKRVVHLSEGLPMQVRFPVQCVGAWVSSEHARVVLPLAPSHQDEDEDEGVSSDVESYLVRGRLTPMTLEIDGRRHDLPSVELKLKVPSALLTAPAGLQAGPSLNAVPAGGYAAEQPRWSVVWSDTKVGNAAKWRFTIERVEAGGDAPVFHRDGEGAPPAVIDWNGLNDAGTPVTSGVHVARITLVSQDGTEVASKREPFGVGVGGSSKQESSVPGKPFASNKRDAKISDALEKKLAEIAGQLSTSGEVDIAVHADGSGDRLKALVLTQAEAKRLKTLLVSLGVAEGRVTVRGRGAAEPLSTSKDPASRRKNQRVVFTLALPGANAESVPLEVHGKSELRINGRLTPVDTDGGFASAVPSPRNGWLTVDMLAPSGRRVAFRVNVRHLSNTSMGGTGIASKSPTDLRGGKIGAKTWRVSGDVAANRLEVDFDLAPAALWTAAVALATVDSLPIPEIVTQRQGADRQLTSPLDFQLVVGDSLAIERWTFFVADDGGHIVHKEGLDGKPPAVVRWDGTHEGAFVLQPDRRYRYWLDLETADASSLSTAPNWFVVDPIASARTLELEALLFTRSGGIRASLRNRLSRFAAQAAKSKAGERFLVLIEVAGDQPRVDSVRAELVSYLTRLGVQAGLYDLVAKDRVGRKDRISIVRDDRPPQTAPSVHVNSQALVLKGSSFSTSIELGEGEPVIIELLASNGAKLRYIGSASQRSRTASSGGELIAPSQLTSPSSAAAPDDGVLASDTPARSLKVRLPPKGTVLDERKFAVSGQVAPGVGVKINGSKVFVAADGRFYLLTELPIGKSELTIRADDALGGSSTISWPLRVSKSHSVVVGHIEGVIASAYSGTGWTAESAAIAGMVPDSTLQVGPVLLSARAQGFVKARVPGGVFADSVEITAQIDTGREKSGSAFLSQVVDPLRSAPVIGDSAEELQDANTRGKVFARVKAGQSTATIGSVHTRLEGGGELFEYDRSADGAVAEVHKSVAGNDVAVRAFSTTGAMTSSKDVNWFRATGGTLFYLRHGQIVEGSEQVRVVIRDRDSGMALDEVALKEGIDYSVDYQSGRIRLVEPLSGTSASTWVMDNMDSSSTPMSGHLVYLSVNYEHEDQDGLSQTARGAYASTTLEERLSVGAGIVSEQRDGREGYRLMGADASLNIGTKSNLRAEVAASRQRDANHHLSMDGGLSFGELQRDLEFSGTGSELQLGWKLSADFAIDDWTDAEEFRDSSLSLYLQDLERGFASGDTVLDQGRLKFGGRLHHRLSAIDRVVVRHEGQVAQLPRVGPTLTDVMANPSPLNPDELASYLTSIQWARDTGRWHYKVEGMHQRITSTAALADGSAAVDVRRLGVGALSAYDYSKRITLRVGQQVIANTADADPVLSPITGMRSSLRSTEPLAGVVTNVGSDFQLAPELSLSGDLFQRWNGDNAARVGLKTALGERGSMYVQEQIGGVDGRLTDATVIGAEERFGEDGGGRSYGEYQVDRGVLGNRNRAVMGLGRHYQVSPRAGLGLGFEHQQAFGGYLPDGASIGDAQRNVLHGSMTYRRKAFRLAAQLELRLDHGDDGSQVDPGVLGDDPREGLAPGGFADHGGPVPGAALVIAPGDGSQILGGVTGEWRFDKGHSWLARARSSLSLHEAPGAAATTTLAKFTELTTGWAFRPERDDRFEVLTRYSFLLEQRPLGLDDVEHTERSHVAAVLPFVRLPRRILLSGKLALKNTRVVDVGLGLGKGATTVNAILALARVGYQFYGKWDASAEVRQLALFGDVDSEWRLGNLLEVGYTLSRQLRMAGGYNFGHFSDNELGDLKRDTHGVFMRITGMY